MLFYDKPDEFSAYQRQQAAPFSSLIERVMHNDFCGLTAEGIEMDGESIMDFNRVRTFHKDNLLFKP